MQCDNGREFKHDDFYKFSQTHGMIRTINNVCRSLLFHASLPKKFWVEALNMATYLLNIRRTCVLDFLTPMHLLYRKSPSYSHRQVFGCLLFF